MQNSVPSVQEFSLESFTGKLYIKKIRPLFSQSLTWRFILSNFHLGLEDILLIVSKQFYRIYTVNSFVTTSVHKKAIGLHICNLTVNVKIKSILRVHFVE